MKRLIILSIILVSCQTVSQEYKSFKTWDLILQIPIDSITKGPFGGDSAHGEILFKKENIKISYDNGNLGGRYIDVEDEEDRKNYKYIKYFTSNDKQIVFAEAVNLEGQFIIGGITKSFSFVSEKSDPQTKAFLIEIVKKTKIEK